MSSVILHNGTVPVSNGRALSNDAFVADVNDITGESDKTPSEVASTLSDINSALGAAITAKGGTVTSGSTLSDKAEEVGSIPSGGVEWCNEYQSGTISPTSNIDIYNNPMVVNHGMSQAPIFVILFDLSDSFPPTGSGTSILMAGGNSLYRYTLGTRNDGVLSSLYTDVDSTNVGGISEMGQTSFKIQGSSTNRQLMSGHTYRWLAWR